MNGIFSNCGQPLLYGKVRRGYGWKLSMSLLLPHQVRPIFYADLLEWKLSGNLMEAAEFVVAWLLYRKGFYEEVKDSKTTTEWSFLRGCAAIRGKLFRAGLFDEINVWDPRLYPEQFGCAMHLAGLLNHQAGDFDKAVECYESALQFRKESKSVTATKNNLSLALAAKGDIGAALQILQRTSPYELRDQTLRNIAYIQKSPSLQNRNPNPGNRRFPIPNSQPDRHLRRPLQAAQTSNRPPPRPGHQHFW